MKSKSLAETLEAIIAAIYYDGGFVVAKETISQMVQKI